MSNEAWLPNAVASAMDTGESAVLDDIVAHCKLLMEPFDWTVRLDDGESSYWKIPTIRFYLEYPDKATKAWKTLGYQWAIDKELEFRFRRDAKFMQAIVLDKCREIMDESFRLLLGK